MPCAGAGKRGMRSNERLQATGAACIMVATRLNRLQISSTEPAGWSPAPELLALARPRDSLGCAKRDHGAMDPLAPARGGPMHEASDRAPRALMVEGVGAPVVRRHGSRAEEFLSRRPRSAGRRSNEVLNLSGAEGIIVAARRFHLQISAVYPAGRSPAG